MIVSPPDTQLGLILLTQFCRLTHLFYSRTIMSTSRLKYNMQFVVVFDLENRHRQLLQNLNKPVVVNCSVA